MRELLSSRLTMQWNMLYLLHESSISFMKKYKMNQEVGGIMYKQFIGWCVYAWCRGRYCLYVGQSKQGISRPLDPNHHVINKIDKVQDDDFFLFYWAPPSAPFDHLDFVEEKLIISLRPKYNVAKNPYYEKSNRPQPLSTLPENVSTHKTLAEVLQREVQERPIQFDPRNLTDENLAEFVKQQRDAKKRDYTMKGGPLAFFERNRRPD